ncbi:SDR family NAD(P)-dependent oxidoreductase [Mycolicibacterium porcinum]|uniref:SDR family oxidoreductase n=1 Tax=Mycolicibacterium porcinum TaxID=39693 RepID=A0AAW5TAN8_9MYCO|nr:SDR family oxidoreductase [Mycolicibacterium porcinum]MBX8686495.1 SDR family oxidoreductase [Mycobacterium sp. 20091114027_K0903767]OCB42627.1 oxidoreductase [Mycolicibacterium vulneris]MCV7391990.1 SDR family oxidoreductase [Mycolicibacterium porcinum]ODR25036.1 oxidoreductase [Mycolicibacterium porcinum]ORB33888.1 oxidoreductase [Mycolicibacterium porcinum]
MTRTALITGAGGGIGLATAARLAADGVQVVATDVKPRPDELPSAVDYVSFDLLAGDVADLLGPLGDRLDYLVNAAGLAMFDRDGSVLDTDENIWDLTLGVNLHALRHLTSAAVPLLRRGEGKAIVNVASTAGVRGMDSPLDAYQVSKAAVVSLSHSLALQLGPEGIRVNTVCPGAILTPMIAPLYEQNPARRTNMEQRTPLRRLGLPADIANAIAFLLSEQASFITATDLIVDGGWTAQIK